MIGVSLATLVATIVLQKFMISGRLYEEGKVDEWISKFANLNLPDVVAELSIDQNVALLVANDDDACHDTFFALFCVIFKLSLQKIY